MTADESTEEGALPRLFDPFFFLSQPGLPATAYDDPWNFFLENALEYPDCDPHPLFETAVYLECYPELAETGENPLLHYLRFGGGKGDSRPNRLFNHRFYLETQSLSPSSVVTPLEHYQVFGGCSEIAPNPNRVIESNYFIRHNHDFVQREKSAIEYLLRFSKGEPRLFSSRIATIANKIFGYQDGPRLDNYRPVRCVILDFSEGTDLGDLTGLIQHLLSPENTARIEFVAATGSARRARLPEELKPPVVCLEDELGAADPESCPAEIASFIRGLVSPYKETLVFSSHPGATPTLDEYPVYPLSEAGDRIRTALGAAVAKAEALRDSTGSTDPKVIVPIVDWQISGVNTWVGEVSSSLAERGWDVELLSSRMFYRYTESPQRPPLPVRHLDIPPSKPEWWWSNARDYLVSQAPAVALTAYDFNFNSLASVTGDGVAMIGVMHSDDPVYYEQVRRLGRSWDHIITVSDHIRDMIGERFPDLHEKTTTIHYGVPRWDGDRPDPPTEGEPLRLLYTGRIAQLQKRLLELPQFLDALEKRGVSFHVTLIGDGPDRAELELELAHRIARKEVEFTGRLPRDEIQARLASSHVFFLISDFEGLPLSLLEAMSHGVVPVVSDIDSGIPEVVHEGETGFRAPIGDYPAFAEILHRLGSDPELWEKVSRRTREYFEEELTVEVMADRTETLIRKLWSEDPVRHRATLQEPPPAGDPEKPDERFGDVWLPPKPPEPDEKKG